jgi:hypothetical protein
MIYHANEVLKWALDPKTGGLHPDLFGPALRGVAFFEIVEVGFIFRYGKNDPNDRQSYA